MDIINLLADLISDKGFPIVMCLYLLYNQKVMSESHSGEIEKLRTTVENNTEVMIKICERLGIEKGSD